MAPQGGSDTNKDATVKRAGGGRAERRRSPSPPVMQTPQGGQADQDIWGNGKLLKQMTPKGPAMPLRQCIHPARPGSYSVKIYLDEIDTLANYGSIFP